MAGPRADKVAVVEEVKGHLSGSDAAILAEYRGLKVAELATLRRALRSAGAEFKIYKNTLVRRATAEVGDSAIDELLTGPTGIAFVEADVAAVAKVMRDFARTNPALVVKGSYVAGSVLDAASTARLADLPSREVLLAQIAGALAAPMQQFAALLKALPQNLAYGLSALADKKREEGDTSEAEAAPVAEATAQPSAESSGAAAEETAGNEPAPPGEEASAPPSDEASAPTSEASAPEAEPEAVAASAEPEGAAASSEPAGEDGSSPTSDDTTETER